MTLDWPRERPASGARATIKAVPEDFRVVELDASVNDLAVADGAIGDDGSGEHLYLRVEKRGLATPDVARWLAEACGVPEAAVGYAGMKDKHAITEQWFSVCTPREPGSLPGREGVKIVAATRRRRKLRRGDLAGNRFHVRLRDVVGTDWCPRLATIRDSGVPNYFGPQRFGSDNLLRATEWLGQRRRRRERSFRTGLYLSVLRSFLFNEVLAARVANGTWNRPVSGDLLLQVPRVPNPHATRAGAAASPRQVPTGPLWGRGRSASAGEALEMERAALAPHAELRDGLEHAGPVQERRSLVLCAADLAWQREGNDVELTFTLAPGAYATTLLGEAFQLVEATHR